MSWYDILTEEELVELESFFSEEDGLDIEASLIEDVDAWAFAEQS